MKSVETQTPPRGTKPLPHELFPTGGACVERADDITDCAVCGAWAIALVDRPLAATFDRPHASSDGGAILLTAADRGLGLLAALTATVPDARASARVTHGVGDPIAQRVFAIDGGRLASQPTISRFERTAAPRMRLAMSAALADTFFNGFYDRWCYPPLVGTLTFDEEARQYHVAAILRPGNAAGSAGAVSLRHRLLPKLRRAFPGARRSSRRRRTRPPRMPRPTIRPVRGRRPGAPSSTPKWCGTTAARRVTTHALSSPTCARRPHGSTGTGMAPAAIVRIA